MAGPGAYGRVCKPSGGGMMTTKKEFAGQVAFVTGAATGIGRASARAFAAEGASLALVDLDRAGAEATAELIRAAGGEALVIEADLTQEDQVRRAVETTVATYGRLDLAHNNAGKFQKVQPMAEISPEEWHRIMDLNLTTAYLCMRHQIPQMLAQGGGCIVNMSSGAGIVGTKGAAAYGAAKHAVIGLTRSAALDYATQNIRINCVCPGVIETNMMREVFGDTREGHAAATELEPVGRLGQPEEIASAVLWLCSAKAGFAIGSAMVVDGGHTIR
jgi:NAD(P)-dependent dehydrogenase (short-subunit alcohol dehydrogenase family)